MSMREEKMVEPEMVRHGSDEEEGVDDDDNNNQELPDGVEPEATWQEVYVTCCVHTKEEWFYGFLNFTVVLFFLWLFLMTLDLMGTSAQVMTGCVAGELFGDNTNPVAGLMIGIICTALVQSSSTTTSIIVSLTGSAITVEQGIYMIMGANIGTTITNTIVAMGQMGNGDQLERAFAGAVINDMFNYLSVIILLPLEVVSGYLAWVSYEISKNYSQRDGDTFNSPLDAIIDPIVDRIILRNRRLIVAIANGSGSCALGGGFYPIVCNGPPSTSTCTTVGLIPCSSQFGCPAFFDVNATVGDDKTSGIVMFLLSIGGLFICMGFMSAQISKMLLGTSTKVIRKATGVNPYLAILIGLGITVLVQSSSITTSVLTPLVGLDVITVESMLPLTLGANIGTTITAIMAALVQASQQSLQVALAHLFFNLTGIAIWFPIPQLRAIPLHLAKKCGTATKYWKGFPFLYIAVAFFLVPLILLGLSTLFVSDSKGLITLGSVLLIAMVYYAALTFYRCKYQNGWEKTLAYLDRRSKRSEFMKNLQTTSADMQRSIDHLELNMTNVLNHCDLPDLSADDNVDKGHDDDDDHEKEGLLDSHNNTASTREDVGRSHQSQNKSVKESIMSV